MRLGALLFALLLGGSMAQGPAAAAVDRQDLAVMQQTVRGCSGDHRIAVNVALLAGWRMAGDRDAALSMAAATEPALWMGGIG